MKKRFVIKTFEKKPKYYFGDDSGLFMYCFDRYPEMAVRFDSLEDAETELEKLVGKYGLLTIEAIYG